MRFDPWDGDEEFVRVAQQLDSEVEQTLQPLEKYWAATTQRGCRYPVQTLNAEESSNWGDLCDVCEASTRSGFCLVSRVNLGQGHGGQRYG
jgi:hypothetical protein